MKQKHAFSGLMILVCCIGIFAQLSAQPSKSMIEIIVAPDHSDWNYTASEEIRFHISVLEAGVPLENIKVYIETGKEKMPTIKSDSVNLMSGGYWLSFIAPAEPCFIRCTVSFEKYGKIWSDYATAAVMPDRIAPTVNEPSDFISYWEVQKAELKKTPVDAHRELLPDRCTDKVDVYQVSIKHLKGRIYGILCMPKKQSAMPAMLEVPGAGVYPHYGNVGMAEKGIITLQIGIHGIPMDQDKDLYTDLMDGALNYYWENNLDDKNHYYYHRVYLSGIRAIDYLFTLPEFDKKNLAVYGGSQGGALSIVTASLDDRITCLGSFYPAFCDLTGFLHNRAGGWPFLFRDEFTNKPEKIVTASYYDVVNFARNIKVPGYYSWGYNDDICPPTSTSSAYNVIKAEKELFVAPASRHWRFPEQQEKMDKWILDQLYYTNQKNYK